MLVDFVCFTVLANIILMKRGHSDVVRFTRNSVYVVSISRLPLQEHEFVQIVITLPISVFIYIVDSVSRRLGIKAEDAILKTRMYRH